MVVIYELRVCLLYTFKKSNVIALLSTFVRIDICSKVVKITKIFQSTSPAWGQVGIEINHSDGITTLANSPQAKKRARQAEKSRQHNASLRSTVRTYIKKVVKAIATGDKTQAEAAYQAAVPVIDRTARKGLIHPNKAARHKSRLSQHIRNMQA